MLQLLTTLACLLRMTREAQRLPLRLRPAAGVRCGARPGHRCVPHRTAGQLPGRAHHRGCVAPVLLRPTTALVWCPMHWSGRARSCTPRPARIPCCCPSLRRLPTHHGIQPLRVQTAACRTAGATIKALSLLPAADHLSYAPFCAWSQTAACRTAGTLSRRWRWAPRQSCADRCLRARQRPPVSFLLKQLVSAAFVCGHRGSSCSWMASSHQTVACCAAACTADADRCHMPPATALAGPAVQATT